MSHFRDYLAGSRVLVRSNVLFNGDGQFQFQGAVEAVLVVRVIRITIVGVEQGVAVVHQKKIIFLIFAGVRLW